jgi:hypothetical protein
MEFTHPEKEEAQSPLYCKIKKIPTVALEWHSSEFRSSMFDAASLGNRVLSPSDVASTHTLKYLL